MNSRDELALSQAINIPHRDLAHKQFTVLRKVARGKNMPVFQVTLNLFISKSEYYYENYTIMLLSVNESYL